MLAISQYKRNDDVSLNAQPPLFGRHRYIHYNFDWAVLYSVHITCTGHTYIGIQGLEGEWRDGVGGRGEYGAARWWS